MEKEHQIFGIRAIIEAIQAGKEVDKVFIQKEISGELMKDLMKVMKRANINFSYVPVEKLNRLTPNNHQGAVATISPISFFDLETLIESVIENGKIGVVLIGDEATVKRVYKKRGKLILHPENTEYADMVFNEQEITEKGIQILGEVIENKIRIQ